MCFIARPQAAQDVLCLCSCWLVHHHRLEAPCERAISRNVSLVLWKGGGTDAAQGATRQGRLQDVCCIHCSIDLHASWPCITLLQGARSANRTALELCCRCLRRALGISRREKSLVTDEAFSQVHLHPGLQSHTRCPCCGQSSGHNTCTSQLDATSLSEFCMQALRGRAPHCTSAGDGVHFIDKQDEPPLRRLRLFHNALHPLLKCTPTKHQDW